jgi:shikimate dehydrogenase
VITYGLIGYPLTHSGSANYFYDKFKRESIQDKEYKLFPLDRIDDLPLLLEQNPSIAGLNVTIPFKESVIPYIDELDATAKDIGAVNTIAISRQNDRVRIKGYNTDAKAFSDSADFSSYSSALILGRGGAAKAVDHVLREAGIRTVFASRNPNKCRMMHYHDVDEAVMKENSLIVNASPVGMYPHIEDSPKIPYQFITPDHFLYDLVYNPEMTVFLKKGELAGAKVQNGLKMLHLQAEAAYRIWCSD